MVCPFCESGDKITTRKGKRLGYYRCRICKDEFTVRTWTIFERSLVPLNKWLYAIYLVVTARKGISSLRLSKELSVTQKTAWFMLGRLREACSGDLGKLSGVVEVDETFIGGRERNKHPSKRLRSGRGTASKTPIAAAKERHGKFKAEKLDRTDTPTLHGFVTGTVEAGSTVYTDEHSGYRFLRGDYDHEAINHTAREYVVGDAHTNGVESVGAVLKRSIYGTWHHVSTKHLPRYVDEVAFRLNEGNCAIHTLDRMDSLVRNAFQHRITYRQLTA